MWSSALRRFAPVAHVLAVVLVLFALSMAVPLAFSVALGDGAWRGFAEGMGLAAGCGGVAFFAAARGREKRELQPRDGFLLAALVWTVLPAFATYPLMRNIPGLSFTDAYFECVSGLTTTGATVLTGLDALAPSVNLWRCYLVWLGGMGIIVLAVAVLPLLGVGGSQLFRAEVAGPMKETKLTPRIADSAKGLWGVYALLTAACVASYRLAGMSGLDALMHAFSTMGLGGFSSHDASFGHFDSTAIEAVAVIFMLAASLSFTSHFLAFRARDLRVYGRDPEARRVMLWAGGATLMVALHLWGQGTYPDFVTALRHAVFNVVSVASTTGFSSVDYGTWPVFAPALMIFLSCFFSSSGSTGGGIKMVRAVVLFHQAVRELTRIVHPRAVVQVKFGGRVVENGVILAVLAFMLMYGATIIAATLMLAAGGLDLVSAATAVIACINNMGPGLGIVGPASTYAPLTDFQTWVCTVVMLLGRLELFTFLVLLTPAFWRK